MPDTKPTKDAMAVGVRVMQEMFMWSDNQLMTPEGRAAIGGIAERVDAYAAERIEEATDGDRTFARLAQVERERDAAIAKVGELEAKCAEAEAVIKIAIDGADVYKRRYEASTEDWNRTVTVMAENDRLLERVRVLEAALLEIRERAGREGRASQVARAALAKAAADGDE